MMTSLDDALRSLNGLGVQAIDTASMRVEILQFIAQTDKRQASPVNFSKINISRALEEKRDVNRYNIGRVSYHFREMNRHGLVVLSQENRIRGAVEHCYKLTRQGFKILSIAKRLDATLNGQQERQED